MMKEIEQQQMNVSQLLRLVEENPKLPIVPMVAAELSGDDEYSWYMGSWGSARVEEIYHDEERIYVRAKAEDRLIEDLADELGVENIYANPDIYNKAREIVGGYKWEKVIAVKINLP